MFLPVNRIAKVHTINNKAKNLTVHFLNFAQRHAIEILPKIQASFLAGFSAQDPA